MSDFLIVGGGVIGLSLAWELSSRGKRVTIVDRQEFGRATSWVGVGIFPPPQAGATHDPLEQLRTVAHRLHVEWSERLLVETGIDNELRRCGGIYLARSDGEAAALRVAMRQLADDGIDVVSLTSDELAAREPKLTSIAADVRMAYYLPDEMQFRSPRHLQALTKACAQRGVEMRANVDVTGIHCEHDHVVHVETNVGRLSADQFVLCGGTWSTSLLKPLNVVLPVEPWRGQLILLKTPEPILSHVVNEGLRYLVPRLDGHIVVGSTVEDVGFDDRTTDDVVAELQAYARGVVPELETLPVLAAWAGLRPKTPDGLPFMGRVPGFQNVSVSAGHFRSGLHLSPATAVFMTQLLLQDTPNDAAAFRLGR